MGFASDKNALFLPKLHIIDEIASKPESFSFVHVTFFSQNAFFMHVFLHSYDMITWLRKNKAQQANDASVKHMKHMKHMKHI